MKLGEDVAKAATADMTRTSGIDTLNKLVGYIRTVVADANGEADLDKSPSLARSG